MLKKLKITALMGAMVLACGGITSTEVAAERMVIYDLDGGRLTSEAVKTVRWYEEAPAPEAEKEHYVFKGWTDGNTVMTTIKHASNDVHLKAVFVPEVYSVTLKDGESIISRTNYAYGKGISDLSVFATANNTRHPWEELKGWKNEKGETVTSVSKTDSGDQVLTAVYVGRQYSIACEPNGGNVNDFPETYQYGTGIKGFPDAEKDGYVFDGWFSDEECTNQVTSISADSHEDVCLYAGYHRIPVESQPQKTYATRTDETVNVSGSDSYSAGVDYSSGCSIPEIGYYAAAVQNGGQDVIDKEHTGAWEESISHKWVVENGESRYVTEPLIIYSDHASQGLTHLPERLSVGSVLYLNGTAYTYSGYHVEAADCPGECGFGYRLMVQTCTPTKGIRYYCFFY